MTLSVWPFEFGGLAKLVKKEMVRGLPTMKFEKKFCEECVLGKHPRTSFSRTAEYRAKEQLRLIHIDIYRPITPKFFSVERYFISFIDDFSRKTWVYFLKEKSEVFQVFKRFKAMVEKETNMHIKYVKSNRGGELLKYCEEQRIRRFLTTPYSPQQNGVAERKNRTILDMVRTMLKSKNVPKEFWAEVVQCAIYVQNRCPHAKLNEKTLQEVWSGRKLSVSHLKVFGNIAYGHVPAQQRTKPKDRSKKYVFIGYNEKTKAYRLFNHITKKVIMSRDVQIDEESKWKWNKSEKESRSMEIDTTPAMSDHETSNEEDEPLQPRA